MAALVIIGSNNLTAGGLYANYEVAIALSLDLTDNEDRLLFQAVEDFLARLTDDGTVVDLTAELLVDLRNDGRFRIDDELSGWQQRSSQGDSLGADRRPDAGSRIFSSSNYAKKRDPAQRRGRQVASGGRTTVAETPEEGATGAPVVLRWSKTLSRSDCAQPRPGSNTTGALRFTKAGQSIDPARFFRQEMFAETAWLPDPTRPGRERSDVRFDVVIKGLARGTHRLELKYDSRRESGQHNFTTDLKWGSLTPVIQQTDLTGERLTIEKLADGSMRMVIGGDSTG